ncbi:uncharacterized protein LOC135222378 [Macrobrachium nipponense]|uniref:uncharacterized protein LOC135222378 n=1 Tax=Macrobrachium nipponense TaxID=159736 RepID=UPI0030C8A248
MNDNQKKISLPTSCTQEDDAPDLDFDVSDISDDEDEEWTPAERGTSRYEDDTSSESEVEEEEEDEQQVSSSSGHTRQLYFKVDPHFKGQLGQHPQVPEDAVTTPQLRPIDYFEAYINEDFLIKITNATNQRYVAEKCISLGVTKKEMSVL